MSAPATPPRDAVLREDPRAPVQTATLSLLAGVAGMSLGLWIDTHNMPAAVLISRCTQSSDWAQALLVHWTLMPASTLLMLLAPWTVALGRDCPRLGRRAITSTSARPRHHSGLRVLCGLLMFAGMAIGARYASQFVTHLCLTPFFGLLLAMTSGMASALILFNAARGLARHLVRGLAR